MIGRERGDAPDYFMLMPAPAGVAMDFVVVGVDFDDHWPGQARYEWHEDLVTEVSPGRWEDLSVYVHSPFQHT